MDICTHGSIRRSCLICELEERIRELEAKIKIHEDLSARDEKVMKNIEQENARLKQEMEQWRMIALTK